MGWKYPASWGMVFKLLLAFEPAHVEARAVSLELSGKAARRESELALISANLSFPTFRPMVFHFAQAKKENFRDQDRLTFLVPFHHTPPHQITSLFAARACNLKVSLLAG